MEGVRYENSDVFKVPVQCCISEGGHAMKRLKLAFAALLACALLPLMGLSAFADNSPGVSDEQIRAAAHIEAIADASTMGDWTKVVENTTENIGRIWTDKSVFTSDVELSRGTIAKGGSDFLTAFSAISSTSNVASTSTTPLDIVLVLDASGSMSDPMGSGDSTKRIDALKDAANGFIDEIAKQNEGVADANKQHQVAIVKFAGEKSEKAGNDTYDKGGYRYNNSQVMKNMAACTSDAKQSFKDTVNSINPAGATRSDYGFELAQGQSSGRDNAKKIVIFFTDGKPTSFSDFDPKVASAAVEAAKSMKDAGASVYTIGIFDGANPSANVDGNRTSNENKFMQAASSNYPNATYVSSQGGYFWNFGNRVENSDFYKSATNAVDLAKIFDDISKEIVKGAGYPTDVTEGYENQGGYITFDDQLGAYMQVDGFKAIALGDANGAGEVLFENPEKSSNGNVDTYIFTGNATLDGKSVNVGDVAITVTKSSDAAVGDAVQVKIPAALIPLRNFTVNETDNTMAVSDTLPIRVFYASSVKAEALKLVANPDAAMAEYIAGHGESGKVVFYANAWSDPQLGQATSSFDPADGNAYYYFTQDTPIYSNPDCTMPAKKDSGVHGGTYYYKSNYFAMESGKPVVKTQTISFPFGTAEQFNGAIGYDGDGNAYFKAGTARLTYIDELADAKDVNETGTASDVLNPKWNDTSSTAAATTVIPHLGNNGKLTVDIPGTLAVSKTLEVPAGFSAADYAEVPFEFTISVPSAAGKTLHAEVKNAAGEVQGSPFALAFDANGKAIHSIKADETLYIYGLTDDSAYAVEETGTRAGFTQVAPVDAKGKATVAAGVIKASETSKASFTNEYHATGTLNGETALAGEKILKGRVWLSSDKFAFVLKDANSTNVAPMPNPSVQEVTQSEGTPAGTQVPFHFGDIEFTTPGEYAYEIHESAADSTVGAGVTMSQALYRVLVTVVDNHNGTLGVTSAMYQITDDDNKQPAEHPKLDVATFTNVYDSEKVSWTPTGSKNYVDNTGEYKLERGMFHVLAKTDNPAAPMPGDAFMQVIDGKEWNCAVTTVDASGDIVFERAVFELAMIPAGQTSTTFTYEISEVVNVGDDGNPRWVDVSSAEATSGLLPAMEYDERVWVASVTLKNVDNTPEISASYHVKGAESTEAGASQPSFVFTNMYDPAPATASLLGTKVFHGRAMATGESFGFGLTPANKLARDAFGSEFSAHATVVGLGSGQIGSFNFDELSFSKPGVYTFTIAEDAYCGEPLNSEAAQSSHIAFDSHGCLATVTVADNHSGALEASIEYAKGPGGTSLNAFANAYSETQVYGGFGGLAITKTLEGRTMHAGEFGFAIEASDDASKALLERVGAHDGVLKFQNPSDRAAGIADVMRPLDSLEFTEADAGKTFDFTVREIVPADADKLAGVTYDATEHAVKIAVGFDELGKNLTVATYVDGQRASEPEVAFNNSYAAGDAVYATADFGLGKVLEGRDWTDRDTFEFELAALTDGAPMPESTTAVVNSNTAVRSDGAKLIDFGTIAFTSKDIAGQPNASKAFVYQVREVVPSPAKAGIDYDASVATVSVTVRDDGAGHLAVSSTAENATFVNRYHATLSYSAAGGLSLEKILNGRDMVDGQFRIEVVPANEASASAFGLPMEGKAFDMPAAFDGEAASALVANDVTFTQLDVGCEFKYTVSELGESGNGYAYDKAVRTVAIAVADDPDNAALTATTTVAGGPEGTKTFVYKTGDENVSPAAKVAFANSYVAVGSVSVDATKTLIGRAMEAGEFSFAMQYAKGAAAGADVHTAKNAADGSVSFGTLDFTNRQLDELVASGSASKQVTASTGDAVWMVPCLAYENTTGLAEHHITASDQAIPFTIVAVDRGTGALDMSVECDEGPLAFTNTSTSATVDLLGVKHLQNGVGTLQQKDIAGKFAFTVTGDGPLPEHTTATNGKYGGIDFGSITFTAEDLDRVLGKKSESVAQAQGADVAMGAGASELASTAGALSAAAGEDALEIGADAAGPVNAAAGVAHAAQAEGVVPDGGSVAGEGAESDEADAVGSAAVVAAAPGVIESGARAEAAENAGASANAVSTDSANEVRAYASEDSSVQTSRSYTFTYVISESGTVAGIANDGPQTVQFKVVEQADGTLTAERVGADDALDFEFTNIYDVQPTTSSVTDDIEVTKTLAGRAMVEGEFWFELIENGVVVARGANDAAGRVHFDAITYDRPGTHEYTMREAAGGNTIGGVTYDGSTFQVTTRVVDNGDGTLCVAHEVADGVVPAFENMYSHGSTSVVLGASKLLAGKALADGQFSFTLTAQDGAVYQAKNSANGSVVFPALTFTEPGTYVYTIAEVNDGQSGVAYDGAVYGATVTVIDDGQGNLVATVSYESGEAPVFKNSYTEPPAPVPTSGPGSGASVDGPWHVKHFGGFAKPFAKTADAIGLLHGLFAVSAGVALVLVGIATYWRRRN